MAISDPTLAMRHDERKSEQNNKGYPSRAQAAIEFAQQAERLGQYTTRQEDDTTGPTQAVEAHFVTPQDPVIQTADGGRLPAVPIEEATKLNKLRDIVEDRDVLQKEPMKARLREAKDGTVHGLSASGTKKNGEGKTDATLGDTKAPWRTSPLFPPLPVYGPPNLIRRAQCWIFRFTSAILSFLFLLTIILGAVFTSLPKMAVNLWFRTTFRDPRKRRPFYQEEVRRRQLRNSTEIKWKNQHTAKSKQIVDADEKAGPEDEFEPLEGGPDPLRCDVRYYARRVGLECEAFEVQTEDGFLIALWHIYNPGDYRRLGEKQRAARSPDVFSERSSSHGGASSQYDPGNKKYPVLLIHGLLQSAGAYCTNDDDSLAFFLAKSGYDVWLGNNRCGFKPRHVLLDYNDPRMFCWNIRQMGVMDLPALISRVLFETGFEKLGLIAHSQGTTETLVALAKEQRPEIGEKISVFCALAPAAYAGPLINKAQFKFMRIISPSFFRIMFGIHAFIPFMMTMHSLLPGRLYGFMGYLVFSFLFDWHDDRWERDLRDRMFQFAPVYVSSESMRWWLGRECFAKQKSILATREENKMEDEEDAEEDENAKLPTSQDKNDSEKRDSDRARYSWFGPQSPPFAFWVCGSDDLVDGKRLLRRFERNREPYVDLVHSKIIEDYEHLDVIWAMDSIEKVGVEVREVIWKTAPESARSVCRTPKGCEEVNEFYKRRDTDMENGMTTTGGGRGETRD